MKEKIVFYSREIFQLADKAFVIAYCSILSFNIFFYVARKKLGEQAALNYMITFLEIIKVVPADITIAMNSLSDPVSDDSEDDLQYYSARQLKNHDYFVTANTKDFKKSVILSVTPLQFLKIYQSV